jgi:hypothetical protein
VILTGNVTTFPVSITVSFAWNVTTFPVSITVSFAWNVTTFQAKDKQFFLAVSKSY